MSTTASLKAVNFQDFGISEETAFARELPDSLPEEFLPWHELASKVPDLVLSGDMQEETRKLALLDSSTITDFNDLRLAHLQLALVAMGFVLQNKEQPAKSLPASVAVPLCDVADRLGLPPCMCNHWFVTNWTRIDPKGPYIRSNIRPRYFMLGGDMFALFQKLNLVSELDFPKLLPVIQDILIGSRDNDLELVTSCLQKMSQWLKEMVVEMKGYHGLDPHFFFNTILHLCAGFNEGNGLPDGIFYEGVRKSPQRKTLNTSAAQSCLMPVLQCILRLPLPAGTAALYKNHRTAWLQKSRDFYEFLESWPGDVRKMAETSSNPTLKEAYNNVIDDLTAFRNYHVGLVTKYTLIPSIKAKKDANDDSPNPIKGLVPMLKNIREDVHALKLC